MLPVRITTRAWTSVSPERVLAAACDFTPVRRERTWPNVSAKHREVHTHGDRFADVTEGTMAPGLWWERCRYDWSESGFVWRARERGTGSRVEMTIYRDFRASPKGLAATAAVGG